MSLTWFFRYLRIKEDVAVMSLASVVCGVKDQWAILVRGYEAMVTNWSSD